MPSPRSVLAISLTLAALFGCAAHDPLANRSLVSIEVTHDGQPMQLARREIPVDSPSPAHLSLKFSANDGFGSSGGCNYFMGDSYTVDGGVLRVRGGDSSTIIGCSVGLMQQDEWFAKFVQSAPAVSYAGDRVILFGTGIATVTVGGAPSTLRDGPRHQCAVILVLVQLQSARCDATVQDCSYAIQTTVLLAWMVTLAAIGAIAAVLISRRKAGAR